MPKLSSVEVSASFKSIILKTLVANLLPPLSPLCAAEIASSRWANKFRFFARFARMLQFLLPQRHLEWWYTVKTPRTRSFPTREFSNHEHKRKKRNAQIFPARLWECDGRWRNSTAVECRTAGCISLASLSHSHARNDGGVILGQYQRWAVHLRKIARTIFSRERDRDCPVMTGWIAGLEFSKLIPTIARTKSG